MKSRQWMNWRITHPELTVKEAGQFFREEYDININETNIYRCIVKAREWIEGSEKAHYSLLRDYEFEILRYNPSLTKGFLGGCQHFICLDGAFFKGYCGAKLLIAIGQDANNHIYPYCRNKRQLEVLLQEDLRDGTSFEFSFMSDQRKCLIPALQEVMSGLHYRFCSRHIWQNFAKQWNVKKFKIVLFSCAKAITP
ncbi:hypothetical protein Ahy_A08g038493 [Arachis hypogaea]|uniref:Uncharacterized protein n=1 Tax=Arachis hypogaea TaxID=3818 RepID=A0A445BTU9_ARAHY|nr:hypothetical protein Ahy_A08g038493 [Arachis hypogaea]